MTTGPQPLAVDADLVRRISICFAAAVERGRQSSPDPESGALDLAAVRAYVEELAESEGIDLLKLLEDNLSAVFLRQDSTTQGRSYSAEMETFLALFGLDRPRITKRFRNNAQTAIRAFGALPFAEGEDVRTRLDQLRWSAKQTSKFGVERATNQLRCVQAAKAHLAQIAGYPDAVRMEFALDADLAAEAEEPQTGWDVGEYRLRVAVAEAQATLVVERAGKALKAVPKQVRSAPAYAEARDLQERLRDQVRRLRGGFLEPLVASSGRIDVSGLTDLLRLPAARALLPAVIWRAEDGTTGLIELSVPRDGSTEAEVSANVRELLFRGLDGHARTLTPAESLQAAHPWQLFTDGVLAAWQQAITQRRIVQPVRQAFREVYLVTPAEVEARDASARFAGHRVDGARATRLLGTRSWRILDSYGILATRSFGPIRAVLSFDEYGHFLAEGDATTGRVHFTTGEAQHFDLRSERIPLTEVPPEVFSEAMRDVDLVVSVAHRATGDRRPFSAAAAETRAGLLAALVADLGLAGVTVDGSFARVQGARARYRVHLGSGSIHIEPAGYLCVVPDSAAARPDRRLFLPFADEDVMTSVILSKVLLLLADDKITDPGIRAQIDAATRTA